MRSSRSIDRTPGFAGEPSRRPGARDDSMRDTAWPVLAALVAAIARASPDGWLNDLDLQLGFAIGRVEIDRLNRRPSRQLDHSSGVPGASDDARTNPHNAERLAIEIHRHSGGLDGQALVLGGRRRLAIPRRARGRQGERRHGERRGVGNADGGAHGHSLGGGPRVRRGLRAGAAITPRDGVLVTTQDFFPNARAATPTKVAMALSMTNHRRRRASGRNARQRTTGPARRSTSLKRGGRCKRTGSVAVVS